MDKVRHQAFTRLGLVAFAFGLASLVAASPEPRPVTYASFRHGNAIYHAVTADQKSLRCSAETYHAGGIRSMWSMIGNTQPVAAITGTFFHTGSGTPVADVLVDGRLYNYGDRGSGIGIDWYGDVQIFDAPFRSRVDWLPYRYGVRGAVRVVTKGVVHPNPQAQAFRDPRIWGKASRTAVGIDGQGRLVLCATPNGVTLSQLGKAMVSRGVTELIALDGGGSTGLYYRGTMVVKPQRGLSNILLVHERAPRSWASVVVR